MKKSDALTGIGLLLGIGMMIYGMMLGSSLMIFWDLSSVLITVGGSFIGSINYSTIRSDEKDR